jgi:hypothetical protein
MSKIYAKLKGLQQQRSGKAVEDQEAIDARMVPETEVQPTPVMAAVPELPELPVKDDIISVTEKKQFPIRLIFIVLGLGVAFIAGGLLSNLATLKNNSLDLNIEEQKNQILTLKKQIVLLQSSMDRRIKKSEETNRNLNKGLQDKIDVLNSGVESRFDSSSANMNHIEAILQSNIDELNTKFNKLQSTTPTSPKTGDQT